MGGAGSDDGSEASDDDDNDDEDEDEDEDNDDGSAGPGPTGDSNDGDDGSDDGPAGTDETGDDGSGGEQVNPDAPVVLSFTANVSALTEGETVRLTAIVTDPDGVDDLIGGELRIGETTLSPFATSADEGAYGLDLTWGNFDQVLDLTFDGEANHELTAVFFDQSGNTASLSLSLRFHCDGADACQGACVDKNADPDHCGTCGNVCPDLGALDWFGDDERCMEGRCIVLSDCIADTEYNVLTCEAACSQAGYVCDEEVVRRSICDDSCSSSCSQSGATCDQNFNTSNGGVLGDDFLTCTCMEP